MRVCNLKNFRSFELPIRKFSDQEVLDIIENAKTNQELEIVFWESFDSQTIRDAYHAKDVEITKPRLQKFFSNGKSKLNGTN